MWQKSRTIATFPAFDIKSFWGVPDEKYEGGGEYRGWEGIVGNNKRNLVQARCHWVHLNSQLTLKKKKHKLIKITRKCKKNAWFWNCQGSFQNIIYTRHIHTE